MPRVKRDGAVEGPVEAVWALVSDPVHLSRWWPDVERVEEATPEAWTTVHRTRRGKTIRADFTRLEAAAPAILAWRQEIEESPFERFLSAAETRISLTPHGSGDRTRVEIRATTRLRGLARLGAPLVRRATRRRLDQALDGLREATASRR
jgi:carbon monoxide dehydrogenase subunit G